MTNETEAPKRVFLKPNDAVLLGQKYGHPDIEQPTVGDGFVSYTRDDIKDARIAMLNFEAEQMQKQINETTVALETLCKKHGMSQDGLCLQWLDEHIGELTSLNKMLESALKENLESLNETLEILNKE